MGGRGGSSGMGKGSGGSKGITGKWSGDQFWGENSKGFGASILDGGKDDVNMLRYGSRQIYEVRFHDSRGSQIGQTRYVPNKSEATSMAKKWLKDND